MAKTSYGAGTIFRRGKIWYVSFWADGRQVQKSSGSERRQDAVHLRDQLLGRKARGETANVIAARVTCGELLDDLLAYAEVNIKPTTAHVWKLCIDANVRPFFGHLKAASLTTAKLQEYRRKRTEGGRSQSTANRELSIDIGARGSIKSYRRSGFALGKLSRTVDRVVLMTYDQHGPTWSGPGPIGALPWQKRSLAVLLTKVPADVVDLGVNHHMRNCTGAILRVSFEMEHPRGRIKRSLL